MKNIEIPYEEDRHFRYRMLEILPGAISWFMLILPFVLSLVDITVAVFFILGYLLIYVARLAGLDARALEGFHKSNVYKKLDWRQLLKELEAGKIDPNIDIKRPKWHADNLDLLEEQPLSNKPSRLIHAVMIATYLESREVLEPTIQSVIASEYDVKKQVILILAYEERGGPNTEKMCQELLAKYGKKFRHAMIIKHPKDMPGELIGKGGNITYAGRKLQKYLASKKIDPLRVPVTTLDADNHPDKTYLGALSYAYCITPDPTKVSYRPIITYTNNIWDAPAPMRVVATGNSINNIVITLRPHMLRNFSSHSQSMQALIETDFWSVRSIVEDGHQFWRTYFRYDGQHEVFPIYSPIYQDAVLARTYIKTLKMQFIQLRRWTWGATDIAYVIEKGFFTKNKVPKLDLLAKTLRLMETHISLAIAAPLLLYSSSVPALVSPNSYSANALPIIVGRVQDIALFGALATIFICFKTLPPKPERYKRRRNIIMLAQWVLMPVTSLVYNSLAAFYSQTRLMFKKYYGSFEVTEKSVITEDKQTIT
jgi:cellulose synthase/poly-beta-1,6-N-acetylglucosamine synthase-like glycosyltransferase